jgi:hypothetical protein
MALLESRGFPVDNPGSALELANVVLKDVSIAVERL